MAERRLPFAVLDDDGVQRQGEVVIVPVWRDDLKRSPEAAFTIVLTERPLTNRASIMTPGLALCVPATAIHVDKAAGEASAPYTASGETVPPIRLSRDVLASYAGGAVLTAGPTTVTAKQVFPNGRLDVLARELLNGSAADERCWQTIDAVLSWPNAPSVVSRPSALRTRLRRLLKNTAALPFAVQAIDGLSAIANGSEPQAAPASLAEDVALVRCLRDLAAPAAEVSAMRAYLNAALPAPSQRDLVVDHASTHERLSYLTLLSEPQSIGTMRAAFEKYRTAYAAAYVSHHATYWRDASQIASALEEAAPGVRALERLNTLSALGRPLGRSALREYGALQRDVSPCDRLDLLEWLTESPRCGVCEIGLADAAPSERAIQLVGRLRDALERQQSRLANEAIRRILARGGERIEQFLQIVQASDQAGLARVLDDDLLAFLDDLLTQPVAITADALDLLNAIARAYPIVRDGDIDGAADELRAWLRERTDSAGEVRLAAPAT